jgi:type VII secretion-associated serine protease mycosin
MLEPGSPHAAYRKRAKRVRILAGSALAVVLLVIGIAIGHVITRPQDIRNSSPATFTPQPHNGLNHPVIDPALLPTDGPPEPAEPLEQTYACQELGVLPDTDFRKQPTYMGMLNLSAAWRFGRGGGVKVAIIDTGVNPHARLPHLAGGGDYIAGGDGLSDCDGHGTIVASMIGATLAATDAYSGIAPDADLISIRQSSGAFTPRSPRGGQETQSAVEGIHSLARAIVHAANMGAAVINISDVICMGALGIADQGDLGAAIRYAAVDKNAVIVAAAGDTSKRNCGQNPIHGTITPGNPRDWSRLATVVTPDWFSEYVLTVGAIDSADESMSDRSVAGPWVSVAAPGTGIVGLSLRDDTLINAVLGPDDRLLVPSGTGFAAAVVSGVAALVRAKFPQLSSHQIIDRLVRTLKPPAGGANDQVGFGVIDPVAALTGNVPEGPR